MLDSRAEHSPAALPVKAAAPARTACGGAMRELLRDTDLVFLSWADALLRAEGIAPVVLDAHMSVLEGSTFAIPRRMMVEDGDYDRARSLLAEAGEGARLGPSRPGSG